MVARRNPAVPRRRVRVAGCPVQTTVTARPAVARRWVYVTLWRERRRLHSAAGLTVGLGVQWTPPFRFRRRLPAGAEPRPGTLQLCVGNRCLVFQLARAGGGGGAVPQILRRFLADGRVTFAAYNVDPDRRKLRAHHGLEVESALELRGAAAGMPGNASMAAMADRLLGIRRGVVEKPEIVSTSKWDGPKLSREQVRYATVDAYISCRLGVYFRRRRLAAMADDDQDDEASEAEYSSDDEVHGVWGRCVGFLQERSVSQDQQAALDDYVYDSISMCSSLDY
ncbi:unnamed protein product [Urochloa decumbens]|uniref:3'-5' exonuclease domain-containing protein n=1 Tax=Urochloa decumbens TaxID=240449 RepID=A0ABC9FLC8_9POAL